MAKYFFQNGFGVGLLVWLPISVLLGMAALVSLFTWHLPPVSCWAILPMFILATAAFRHNWRLLWHKDEQYKGFHHFPLFLLGIGIQLLLGWALV